MFMIDQEDEKVGTLPAACQVEPAVSSFFSSSRQSVQPGLGQVIQRRDADDAAADDEHAHVAGNLAQALASPFDCASIRRGGTASIRQNQVY